MKVSIITPTLNVASSLERTITSVLSQNFQTVEHLIVDGGSTDGTIELVQQFSRLEFLCGPDEGIFDAMNKGITAATGNWIYFLGADDYFVDDSVLHDLEPLFGGNYDVIYGDVVSSRFGGRYDGPFDITKIRKRNICHQAVFFRRELFTSIGMFDKNYRSHADWDHNMRWFLNRTISREYIDRVIAVYADGGFSSVNPDPEFERDRLFRYLTYGRGSIPTSLSMGLWCKEFLLALRYRDFERLRRTFSIFKSA